MSATRIDCAVTVWSKRAGLFLAGWMACSMFYGTYKSEKAVAAVPVLQAEAGCEHWRADKSAAVAKQAITSATSDTVPIPSPQQIPHDCAHPSVLVQK